jgi:hypothetical protein
MSEQPKQIATGGPAFPFKGYMDFTAPDGKPFEAPVNLPGMSLREWYAGMAMAALIQIYENSNDGLLADSLASEAFGLADSMIAARKENR